MLKVFLHGNLGKTFGKKWEFDVDTPMDVFKAIDANVDGFVKYLAQKDNQGIAYNIFMEDGFIRPSELYVNQSKKSKMHVIPVVKGSDSENSKTLRGYGVLSLITGFALGWAGDLIDGILGTALNFTSNLLIEIGGALLIQGLIGALQDEPDVPEPELAKASRSTASFIFSNPGNNVVQGARVPVGYGRLRVGSHVISSAVLNSRLLEFNDIVVEQNQVTQSPKGPIKATNVNAVVNR